jgi:glutamyl-tRNA reductase
MRKTPLDSDARIWLVGTGAHAAAYVKVLKKIAPGEFLVVGRDFARAKALASAESLDPAQVMGGGVDALLKRVRAMEEALPSAVIISWKGTVIGLYGNLPSIIDAEVK